MIPYNKYFILRKSLEVKSTTDSSEIVVLLSGRLVISVCGTPFLLDFHPEWILQSNPPQLGGQVRRHRLADAFRSMSLVGAEQLQLGNSRELLLVLAGTSLTLYDVRDGLMSLQLTQIAAIADEKFTSRILYIPQRAAALVLEEDKISVFCWQLLLLYALKYKIFSDN